MDRDLISPRPARLVLGGLFVLGLCTATDASLAQAQATGQTGQSGKVESSKAGTSKASATGSRGSVAPRAGGQPAGAAVRAAQPSPAYQESLRQTVERRRQRRARRQQNAGMDSGAVGAIVPWPMPPALIIRHTREVHGEVDSLLYGLRR